MNQPITDRNCKQHPDRPGGISCQRCGEAMCPSCMHQASVGWHCPACVRSSAKVQAPAVRAARVAMNGHQPIVTMIIMAACIAVFVWDISQGAGATSGRNSVVARDLSLWAPAVQFNGEWYRIITSAFSHSGLMHIGFNMWVLWQLGQVLEGRFGSLTFIALFGTGIVGGSLGAMLIEPRASVVGASGAVFALLGVLAAQEVMAGRNLMQSGLGRLLMINIFISFLPGISLGGHMGGLIIGALCGVMLGTARKAGTKAMALVPIAIAGVGLIGLIALIPIIERAALQAL